MNLRLALVLITVLSYVAIGATWFMTTEKTELREPEPPFFYTLAPEDLRNISITTGEKTTGWSLREDERRWYFDEYDAIPADLFRWGGITQLLGGPRTQRVLSQSIDDKSLYGLDTPSSEIKVTLRDGSEVKLILGNLTPDGGNHYARVEGFPQLVLVDNSWGSVLERLVNEPPLPEWYYVLDGQPREVILFDNNEVIRAYGYDRTEGTWAVCDVPLETDPCTGTQAADGEALEAALANFGDPQILGAVALGLNEDIEYEPFGATVNSPYIAVRIENETQPNVIEVTRLTMTIGDVMPGGNSRYAVANETNDIIAVDSAWADQILDLFFGELLVDAG